MPSIIVVANTETKERIASRDDQPVFQLKERVSASDIDNPHFSSQLIERIGWALADAENADSQARTPRPDLSGARCANARASGSADDLTRRCRHGRSAAARRSAEPHVAALLLEGTRSCHCQAKATVAPIRVAGWGNG